MVAKAVSKWRTNWHHVRQSGDSVIAGSTAGQHTNEARKLPGAENLGRQWRRRSGALDGNRHAIPSAQVVRRDGDTADLFEWSRTALFLGLVLVAINVCTPLGGVAVDFGTCRVAHADIVVVVERARDGRVCQRDSRHERT